MLPSAKFVLYQEDRSLDTKEDRFLDTSSILLIHISLPSFFWTLANSIAPDVTQNAASHLGLFCLRKEFLLKNRIKFNSHT